MTNTFEAVERLRADLALLTADLETKSRIAAVSGVETGDSMVDAAREIVAVREQLRLKRMALHEAERRHDAEKAEAEKALRDADRERCCELTDELEKTGKTFVLAIKRAAKHYERLYELESSAQGCWPQRRLAGQRIGAGARSARSRLQCSWARSATIIRSPKFHQAIGQRETRPRG